MSEHQARLIVAERSQNRCELCGAEGTNVHHRVKAGQGGAWRASNLVRLCGSGTTGCHGRIEREPDAAKLLGLWLPATAASATSPMLCRPTMWWAAWWQPEDDGTWTYQADPTDAEQRLLGTLAATV